MKLPPVTRDITPLLNQRLIDWHLEHMQRCTHAMAVAHRGGRDNEADSMQRDATRHGLIAEILLKNQPRGEGQ